MPPKPRMNIADLAQRTISFSLVGLSVWGLWLTAAVWKSRRGDQRIEGVLGFSPEAAERVKMENAQRLARDQQKIDPPPARPT